MRRLSTLALAVLGTSFSSTALIAEDDLTTQNVAVETKAPHTEGKLSLDFQPFTGAVKGNNVRLRLSPDLEGHIVQQLGKDDLLIVRGEEGDFWIVEPPTELKAYVFRSFILENTIEGNRVNVRLEPSLESPVIAHLNTGDKVEGVPSTVNNKWLEINAPAQTKLYVAKDYIDFKGPVDLKAKLDKKKSTLEKLYDTAVTTTKTELKKPFDEINIQKLTQLYTSIIRDYKDFPQYVEQATESLASLQEVYLQKKVAFLEARSTALEIKTEEKKKEEPKPTIEYMAASSYDADPASISTDEVTDKMRSWLSVEESLYVTWSTLRHGASLAEYYEEQQQSAVPLAGVLEAYAAAVRNKPGDFIIRDQHNVPIAYLYSTEINLDRFVGQKVSVRAVPRSNNNFAFPAYCVISQDN